MTIGDTRIRTMIALAGQHEESTSALANTLRRQAAKNGVRIADADLEDVVDFVRRYIEHVPYDLEQGPAAAEETGLSWEMGQMSRQLESYWFEPNDLTSDRDGLWGLLDDACASLLLLQGLSDYCRASFGWPLIGEDLTQANQGVRATSWWANRRTARADGGSDDYAEHDPADRGEHGPRAGVFLQLRQRSSLGERIHGGNCDGAPCRDGLRPKAPRRSQLSKGGTIWLNCPNRSKAL